MGVTHGAQSGKTADPKTVAEYTLGAPCGAWHLLPVRRPVRDRGDREPERDESVAEPEACLLLLCARPAEHHPQDLGRQGRELGQRTVQALPACVGQLEGADG